MTEAIGGDTAVAPEVETSDAPVEEAPEETPEELPEVEPQEAEADPDEEPEEDDEPVETREYDFGGNKLELPKDAVPEELADKIESFTKDIYADYQRKSQANAETAKSLAAEQEASKALAGLNGEALQTYSHGLQLRAEIEQLAQYDVNALWQSNPDQARRLTDTLAQKRADFQETVARVGQQEQALTEAQQADLVRRSDEGKAMLDKHIANFSTDKAPDVVKYVVDAFGMPQAEADKWATNPAVTIMAYESMLYRRMQAKTAQPKPKPKQAAPVAPIKGAGKASGTRDPDKMSVAAMAKHLGLPT